MSSENKDQRVTIMMSPTELAAIDEWSFQQRIRSRGEAIRQLIRMGFMASLQREREAHKAPGLKQFED